MLGDDVARGLEERLDALERRLGLEVEARRRLDDLARRVEALEVSGSRLTETKPVQNWTPVEHGLKQTNGVAKTGVRYRTPEAVNLSEGARDLGADAPPASENGRGQQAASGANSPSGPAARFDRKANHRRYMVLWRAKQKRCAPNSKAVRP
jgi:hypothetical protein